MNRLTLALCCLMVACDTPETFAVHLSVTHARMEQAWVPHILCETVVGIQYTGDERATITRGQVVYRYPDFLDMDTRYHPVTVATVWEPTLAPGRVYAVPFERRTIAHGKKLIARQEWTIETADGVELTASDEVVCDAG